MLPLFLCLVVWILPSIASAQHRPWDRSEGHPGRGHAYAYGHERHEGRQVRVRRHEGRQHRVLRHDGPVNAIPEPSAALAFGIGALVVGAATARRRRR